MCLKCLNMNFILVSIKSKHKLWKDGNRAGQISKDVAVQQKRQEFLLISSVKLLGLIVLAITCLLPVKLCGQLQNVLKNCTS